MSTSTQQLGRAGEDVAADFLQRRGMRVLQRNWRCAQEGLRGELDLIAWDGPVLVFCEVKTRRGGATGGPLAAVTPRKQAQLRRLAGAWLAQTPVAASELRFDVVGVTWPRQSDAPRVVHLRGVC